MSSHACEPHSDSLPHGWAWTTIGEITQPIEKVDPATELEKQFTYLDISSIDNTTNVIRAPKAYRGADAPSRARQLVRAHDVLFSTVRTYLKNIAQVPEAYDGQIASTGFSVLRGEEGISSRYLFYFSLTTDFLSALADLQRGTSYPAVRDGDVRAQPIPLAPATEQHRIVAEIEKQFTRLNAGVAALKRAQANLKRYRAAVLKAACEGKLVPQDPNDESASKLLEHILAERRHKWEKDLRAKGKDPGKAKYVEPEQPDTDGLLGLPHGWRWVSLQQCFEVERGRFGVRPRNNPRYYNGPYPFVQIGDLPHDGGSIASFSQTLNENGLQVSKMFRQGTVLIAIVGATIANTGILTFDSCCPDSLVAIQSGDEIRQRFVELYLQSKKLEIRKTSYASGGQPNINLATLLPYPVPVPPLAEQRRIVAEVERRLSVVQEVEAVIAANLARAERLRQSILKQAFEGKLVPQDPNDEPASVLLKRIRAQRAEVGAIRESPLCESPVPKSARRSRSKSRA